MNAEKKKYIDGLRGLLEWIEGCPDELADTFYAAPFYLFVRNADQLRVAARAITVGATVDSPVRKEPDATSFNIKRRFGPHVELLIHTKP